MEIVHLASALLNKHSLNSWRVEYVDNQTIAGSCDYNNKRILLSKNFCKYNKEGIIIDVILHEIAHALVGYENGHNKVWKKKFIEIGGSGDKNPRCKPFTDSLYGCRICGASYSQVVGRCKKCRSDNIIKLR